MEGKKGLGTRLWKMSSQFVSLKKRWLLISSASASLDPSLLVGSLVSSCTWHQRAPQHLIHATAHLLQDTDAVLGHVDGIQRLILEDGVKNLVLIVTAERRLTQEHLVDEYSKGPPIDSTAVPLLQDDLRRGKSVRV
jgi:hypothetical protein